MQPNQQLKLHSMIVPYKINRKYCAIACGLPTPSIISFSSQCVNFCTFHTALRVIKPSELSCQLFHYISYSSTSSFLRSLRHWDKLQRTAYYLNDHSSDSLLELMF